MKRTCRALAALALAIMLPACAVDRVAAPPPAAASEIAAKVDKEGTRALIIAHYAYQAAANTALTLVKLGTIKGEDATRVRAVNRACLAALARGQAAIDAAGRIAAAESLLGLVVELDALIRR